MATFIRTTRNFYHWAVPIYDALHVDLHLGERSACRLVSIKFGIEKLPQFQANRLCHLTPAVIDRISTQYIYGIVRDAYQSDRQLLKLVRIKRNGALKGVHNFA